MATVLLILFALVLIFRRKIFPWLLLFFVNRLMKKMQDNVHQAKKPTPEKPKKKSPSEMGEYIDYEEID